MTAHGVPVTAAARVASLLPVSVLFASLLGYNPVSTLLDPSAGLAGPPGEGTAADLAPPASRR